MSSIEEQYVSIPEGVRFFEECDIVDPNAKKIIKLAQENNIWPEVAGRAFDKLQTFVKPTMKYEVWVVLAEAFKEVSREFNLALN